jgi:hypothetical protein
MGLRSRAPVTFPRVWANSVAGAAPPIHVVLHWFEDLKQSVPGGRL